MYCENRKFIKVLMTILLLFIIVIMDKLLFLMYY